MAAEQAKVDPMHQFAIQPMFGTDSWSIAGYNIAMYMLGLHAEKLAERR